MKKLYKKIKSINRIYIVSILVIIVLIVSVAGSSFARFKHRISFLGSEVWSGNTALNYHSGTGTKDNPYVISTGEEFMFFAENLKNTDYANTYFTLKKDIILNDEIFSYDKIQGVTYEKDGVTHNVEFNKTRYTDINKFSSINNFKGTFDGDFHTIYGLFLTSEEDLAFFKNLSGTIKNLYLENTLIYGNNVVSALAINTENAVVENISISGNVIGSDNDNIISQSFPINDITINNNVIERPLMPENILSITLNGTYEDDENGKVIINSEELMPGEFSINLNVSQKEDNIIGSTGNLKNLSYTVTYNNKVSTTLAYNSNNSIFNNIINKASVYSKENAAGFIFAANNTSLIRGYNTGKMSANITSGVVYNAQDLNINNIYFNGSLEGLEKYSFLVNNLNGQTHLNNIVNLSDNYIAKNNYGNISISGLSYYDKNILNSLENGITVVDSNIENYLKDINYLSYENDYSKDNVWLYEDNNMPILFFDDTISNIVSLKVGNYSWNNLSEEVDTLKIENDISFTVEEDSSTSHIKEVYYALENNITDIDTISWTTYTGKVNITEKGYYVIYIKIVDTMGKIYYINSDLIALKDVSSISLNIDGQKYSSLQENPKIKYVSSTPSFNIEIYDQNNVKALYYSVGSQKYTRDELETLTWQEYVGSTIIEAENDSIVYVMALDFDNNKTYINSDIITKGGYAQKNLLTTDNSIYLTKNDKVKLNFKFQNSKMLDGVKSLNFNYPLPKKTSIILIDNTTKKVYKHDVLDTPNKLYLNTFKEIGIKETKYFLDDTKENEDYTIIIDFKEANIVENIENLQVKMMLEKNKTTILSTLDETIVNINIINNLIATKTLNTNFSNSIYYNENMTHMININIERSLLSYNGNSVINKSDNTIVIARIIDEEGNIIPEEYLNNLEFKIGDSRYYYNKGKVKFDIGSSESAVINLTTYDSYNNLASGSYTLEFGILENEIEKYFINIPIIVQNEDSNISIDMISSKSLRKKENAFLTFNIINDNNYIIKPILYKKAKLTAYDQEYVLIDINNYLNNITQEESKITIDLNTKLLENNGYMLGFELYKDDEKIGEINKKFIVR